MRTKSIEIQQNIKYADFELFPTNYGLIVHKFKKNQGRKFSIPQKTY